MTQTVASPPFASLTVIVPAHQAVAEIGLCLDAILAAGFAAHEVLVVDDGSRDGTGDVARLRGIRVIRNDTPLRPARARNAGVAATRSDLVVFVDADVVIHPGARARIDAFFASHPGHVALFGSYDDAPAAQRPVSRYRNLLHHWVHQQGRADAETFWTGFGVVRRDAFVRAGGLDPQWENIEDVELGLRLRAAGGQIRLDRDLLCKHLKDWTLQSMLRTDWKGRAVPWTRLLAAGRAQGGDLNLARAHQASGICVVLALITLPLAAIWPPLLWATLATTTGFIALNAGFLGFLARTGGAGLALRAAGFHALHYLAAVGGYAEGRLRPLPPPAAPK